MLIEVTADDIQNGLPSRCGFCPVALALARAAKRQCVHVDSACASVGTNRWYTLPAEAIAFIAAFDQRQPVAPFAFELSVEEGATAP